MKKILIFGGCVSRDSLDYDEHGDFQLSNYYARSSLASLSASPSIDKKILLKIESKFQRRMVEADMAKTFWKTLANDEFDILLMDFLVERFPLVVSDNGSINTISNEYKKAIDGILIGRKISPNSGEKLKLWKKSFKILVNTLQERKSLHKLKISKVFWHNNTDRGTSIHGITDGQIERANTLLTRLYLEANKLIPSTCFIEYPENTLYCDSDHKWGVAPYHFNSAFQKLTLDNLLETNDESPAKIEFSHANIISQQVHLDIERLRNVFKLVVSGDYDKQFEHGYRSSPSAKPVSIVFPIDWRNDDRNTEFNLHAWRFLNPIWNKLLTTGGQNFFDEAMSHIGNWLSFSKKEKNKFLWYDMAVGLRAIHLGFILRALDVLSINLNKTQTFTLSELVELHKNYLSDPKFITCGNHALYQIIGLRLLTLYNSSPDIDSYCNKIANELISNSFDKNYVNIENSPFYHEYNIDILKNISRHTFPDISNTSSNVIKNAKLVSGWLTDPHGNFYRIGDTDGIGIEFPSDSQFMNVATFGASCRYIYNDLGESGYQIVRTRPEVPVAESSALIFHATNKSYVHSHSDHLSFVLFHGGMEIFTDPGKYSYEHDQWRKYFTGDASHNTVGLESKIFGPRDIELGSGELHPMIIEDGKCLLSGSVKKGTDFYHHRKILFDIGASLTLIDNVVNNHNNRTEIRLICSDQIDYICSDKNIVLLFSASRCVAEIHFPESVLEIRTYRGRGFIGWISKTYKTKLPVFSIRAAFNSETQIIETKILLKNKDETFNTDVLIQNGFQRTNRIIKGYDEYIYMGCRFIFRRNYLSKLVVLGCSSIPEDGCEQKYKYINSVIPTGVNFLFVLDTDFPFPKNNGTYYLSENLGSDYITIIKKIAEILFPHSSTDQYLLIGSAKGASAALIYGLKNNHKHFLIHAPQIRIADYLRGRDVGILKYLCPTAEDEIILNGLLPSLLKKNIAVSNSLDITIICGRADFLHLEDIKYLDTFVNSSLITFRKIFVDGGHSDISASLYQNLVFRYVLACNKLNYWASTENIDRDLNLKISRNKKFIYIRCDISTFSSIDENMAEFAFYFFENGTRIDVRWYKKDNTYTYQIPNDADGKIYSVTAFARDCYTHEKHMLSAAI